MRKNVKQYDAAEIEEKLKRLLNLEWVKVLTVGRQVYCKHKMGYAVGVSNRVVRGVDTGIKVPVLIRFSPEGPFVNAVIPLELDAVDPLWDLVKEARRIAILMSTSVAR